MSPDFIPAHQLPPLPPREMLRLAHLCELGWRRKRLRRQRERRGQDLQTYNADRRRAAQNRRI